MTEPDLRRASRLILLDGQWRVLFRHAGTNGEAFWAPPGGGLARCETFEQAAWREELGLTCFTLNRIWERVTDFVYIDHPVHRLRSRTL
jgi:ADP-ribose pyrophosphatase YjhB (NUDIX family)